MRRKDNTESLKQVIDRLLNVYQLEDKFTEVALIKSWSDLLGPAIAKRTTRLFIKDRKLFVTLNSAPLKQELSLGKSRLIELLNEPFGRKVIEEIVFL